MPVEETRYRDENFIIALSEARTTGYQLLLLLDIGISRWIIQIDIDAASRRLTAAAAGDAGCRVQTLVASFLLPPSEINSPFTSTK